MTKKTAVCVIKFLVKTALILTIKTCADLMVLEESLAEEQNFGKPMTGFNIIIAIALGARPHQYLEHLCYFQQIQAFYWYLAITGNRDQSTSSWTGHFLVYIAMKLGIPSSSQKSYIQDGCPMTHSDLKGKSQIHEMVS